MRVCVSVYRCMYKRYFYSHSLLSFSSTFSYPFPLSNPFTFPYLQYQHNYSYLYTLTSTHPHLHSIPYILFSTGNVSAVADVSSFGSFLLKDITHGADHQLQELGEMRALCCTVLPYHGCLFVC